MLPTCLRICHIYYQCIYVFLFKSDLDSLHTLNFSQLEWEPMSSVSWTQAHSQTFVCVSNWSNFGTCYDCEHVGFGHFRGSHMILRAPSNPPPLPRLWACGQNIPAHDILALWAIFHLTHAVSKIIRIRIHLLARRNLLWDILRLPSSHRAALGLYVILTLWRAWGANQPPNALLHRSPPRYTLRHGRW